MELRSYGRKLTGQGGEGSAVLGEYLSDGLSGSEANNGGEGGKILDLHLERLLGISQRVLIFLMKNER